MFKKTKFAVVLAIAAASLAIAASSALALEASVSPGGTISATSSSVSFTGGSFTIVCPLTMTNSLLRGPIGVAAGNQIGETTAVAIGSCTGGSVERVLALNWRLIINSILTSGGAAERENLTGFLVRIHEAAFNLATFFELVNCLYKGDAGALIALTRIAAGRYTVGNITALESVELPFVTGSGACPATGRFKGTFTIRPAQTITVS